MDTSDPPRGLVGLLPGFRQPVSLREDPTLPGETETDQDGSPPGPANPSTDPESPPRPSLLSGLGIPKLGRADTRTATSSTGRTTPEDAAKLIIGLGGLAVGLAAWAVRARLRRRLRRPTEEELADVAAPVGRILHRRWGHLLGTLGPDLADLILAGTAAGNYVNAGPLLEPDHPDPGLPADLHQSPDEEYR